MDDFQVGVLGTCRVHEPIRAVAKAGKVIRQIDPAFGFMHTPREISQSIEVLRRNVPPPSWGAELISLSAPEKLDGSEDLYLKRFGRADVLIIEISSMKEIVFDGWCIQSNVLGKSLVEAGFPKSLAKRAFEKNGISEALLNKLEMTSPRLFNIFDKGIFANLTADDVAKALDILLEKIDRPVLLVGHFVEVGPFADGPIPARVQLRDILRSVAHSRPGTGFMDPTEHIAEYGFEHALDDGAHYKKSYLLHAGEKLVEAAKRLAG